MSIYYQNSKGQKILFDKYPVMMLDGASVFDIKTNYDTKYNKPVNFNRKMIEAGFELIISGKTKKEYLLTIQKLAEIFEYDIIHETPGKLYIDDYYLECFIYESEKGLNYYTGRRTSAQYKLVASEYVWTKEKHINAKGVSYRDTLRGGFDYNYIDYGNIDFGSRFTVSTLLNDSVRPANMKIILYGPCENPEIQIGENVYRVLMDIEQDSYIEIDQKTKKINYVLSDGTEISSFNNRDKNLNIFEKVESGTNIIVWNTDEGYDITLYQERSEPVWT